MWIFYDFLSFEWSLAEKNPFSQSKEIWYWRFWSRGLGRFLFLTVSWSRKGVSRACLRLDIRPLRDWWAFSACDVTRSTERGYPHSPRATERERQTISGFSFPLPPARLWRCLSRSAASAHRAISLALPRSLYFFRLTWISWFNSIKINKYSAFQKEVKSVEKYFIKVKKRRQVLKNPSKKSISIYL